MQLKKNASGCFTRCVFGIEYDYYLLLFLKNQSVFDRLFTAVALPLVAMHFVLNLVQKVKYCFHCRSTLLPIYSNRNKLLQLASLFVLVIVYQICPIRAGVRFASVGIFILFCLLRKLFFYS